MQARKNGSARWNAWLKAGKNVCKIENMVAIEKHDCKLINVVVSLKILLKAGIYGCTPWITYLGASWNT